MTPLRQKRSKRRPGPRALNNKAKNKPQASPPRGILFTLRRTLVRTGLAITACTIVMMGALDQFTPAAWRLHAAPAAPTTSARADPPNWLVDLTGDGVPDLANPTLSFVRDLDVYGSGHFGASRDGGKRKHEGADFIAPPGTEVHAPVSGVVTRMGYAYDRDKYLRFVEVWDAPLHLMARVFYVDPSIAIGQAVTAGDVIGKAQILGFRYPFGMTNHVHVEISDGHGFMFDPAQVLPPARMEPIFAALKADWRLPNIIVAKS